MITIILIWYTSKSGLNIRNPSTAEDTEIGGVIIPSANSALPPIMAGTISH